ncbi:hypothetical protein [Spirosoma telluris]|uniref:hypothetical protein n=1 Tax=Spirosoma telluris TaxID=2183553 RepID=UPI002FC30561
MNRRQIRLNKTARAFTVLLIMACLTISKGLAQTVLTISGEVTKPLTLQAPDLKAMAHVEVIGNDRDGKEHNYSGIPLAELLKQAGATLGSALRAQI